MKRIGEKTEIKEIGKGMIKNLIMMEVGISTCNDFPTSENLLVGLKTLLNSCIKEGKVMRTLECVLFHPPMMIKVP